MTRQNLRTESPPGHTPSLGSGERYTLARYDVSPKKGQYLWTRAISENKNTMFFDQLQPGTWRRPTEALRTCNIKVTAQPNKRDSWRATSHGPQRSKHRYLTYRKAQNSVHPVTLRTCILRVGDTAVCSTTEALVCIVDACAVCALLHAHYTRQSTGLAEKLISKQNTFPAVLMRFACVYLMRLLRVYSCWSCLAFPLQAVLFTWTFKK